jgi:hypothetical protein
MSVLTPTFPDLMLMQNRTEEHGKRFMRALRAAHLAGQELGHTLEEAAAWVKARTGLSWAAASEAYLTYAPEIPDNSRSHLAALFRAEIVDPADYATSQAIWRKPNADATTGPQHIFDVLTEEGKLWFMECRTDNLPRNQAGLIPSYRRLLKRDGMRSMADGDDLLILSCSDDGIIDQVRAGRSLTAYASERGMTASAADERLSDQMEAAFDADQEDYGTTQTFCFAIPSGERVTDCEMG